MGRFIDVTLRFVDKFSSPMSSAIGKLEKSGSKIQRAGKQIEKVGKNIEKVGKGLTKNVTAPLVAIGTAAVTAGIEYESAFAGVKKTLDVSKYSAEEAANVLKGLEQGFIGLSKEIPVAAKEIAGIGELAGQLGIDAENILSFSKTIADLGATTNLTYDTAASSLAKYANITGMAQTDFNKLGSVIVDLGNKFATTESDIVEMGMRIAGAGAQIGLTDGEIMGISAALSSVGIEAEMGGSAFSKSIISMQVAAETGFDDIRKLSKVTGMSLRELELMSSNDSKSFKAMAQSLGYTQKELNSMIKAGKNLENFADVAGLTAKEFKTLFEKDAAKAVEAFITGLGDVEGKGESTIKMLQDMGFTEVRLRDSLTRLANSSGNLSKAISVGNEAWEENSALQNEANQRYETTASRMEIIKNKFVAVGIKIKDVLQPSIDTLLDKVDAAVTWFSKLDDKTQQNILKFAGIAAVAGPVILVFGKTVTSIGKIVTSVGTLGRAIAKGVKAFDQLKKIGSIGTAFSKFGSIGKAAFMALVSPAGKVILVVAGIAAVALFVIKNWNKVKDTAGSLAKGIKSAFGGIGTFFSNIFDGVKTAFKTFVNFIISGINLIPKGLNKLNITIPSWIPLVGGKSFGFNLPTIPMLYKGTDNWRGGPAMVHDKGAEIINLPTGTQVIPHDKSLQLAEKRGERKASGSPIIHIDITDVKLNGYSDVKNFAKDIAMEIVQGLKKVQSNM